MEIYLDDCADDDDLIAYLSSAGHTVYTPRSEGTLGAQDRRHLEYAAGHGLTLLTRNPDDFRELHDAWQAQGRLHSGILLIYQDNVKGKDMTLPDVVRALRNLIASSLPIANEIHVLNHWQ
jgi:hypothetical protein